MPADIKLLKAALEDARFDDPEIREKIYACINSIADDLIEVNFSASLPTDQLFDDLEEYLNDETEDAIVVDTEEVDDEDDDEEVIDDDDVDDEEDDEGIVLDTDEEEDGVTKEQ